MSKFADQNTSYKDKVSYVKEASKTVATIYGSYIVGASVYDKIISPSSFGGMGKTDASGYQNYWNQVKQGVSVEQRYNLQRYGKIDGIPISNNPITGYTKHGLQSAMSHDGVGIHPSSILRTVKESKKIIPGSNHTVRYIGLDGVVNLNYDGKITTTWSRSKKNWRLKK